MYRLCSWIHEFCVDMYDIQDCDGCVYSIIYFFKGDKYVHHILQWLLYHREWYFLSLKMLTRAGTVHSLSYRYESRYLFHDMILITIHELVLTFHFFFTKQCLLEQNMLPCRHFQTLVSGLTYRKQSVWLVIN
jgi:hypothetical protein